MKISVLAHCEQKNMNCAALAPIANYQGRARQGKYYNPCPLSALSLLSLSALLAPVRGLFLLPYNFATNEDSDLNLSGYDH